MFKSQITNEEINDLKPLQFEGQIHLISSDRQVESAVSELTNHKSIGFDTETKPSFTKNRTNNVALLQLATDNDAFLFRLKTIRNYKSITSILSNPEIQKIGVAVNGDLKDLIKLNKFVPSNFIELQSYVKNFQIENIGLKKLCAIVLNGRISKKQQRSNWEAPELSEAQLIYAATDAWASLQIFKKLNTSL